jgi:hypothetical protein
MGFGYGGIQKPSPKAENCLLEYWNNRLHLEIRLQSLVLHSPQPGSRLLTPRRRRTASSAARFRRPLAGTVRSHEMALSLGFASPSDLLEKVERDLVRLESSISAQDRERIADALYDFSVSVTSIKDWLKSHSSKSYTAADVENLVAGSAALSSFRDVANTNKHRFITHYKPTTEDATFSVMPSHTLGPITKLLGIPRAKFRAKIIRVDGARLEASELGRKALSEWRAFMSAHGV